MRGDLYNGFFELSGDFPPSLNTFDDPSALKVFESPSCYGVDHQKGGRLKTGSCPTGTARIVTTKSAGGLTWTWIYNRMWRTSASTLYWCPPYYDDFVLRHGVGKLTFECAIIGILPVFQGDLLVFCNNSPASSEVGCYIIRGASGEDENMTATQIIQDFTIGVATYATLLGTIPFVANDYGVFSYDGNSAKEWTAPIRNSLGSFSNVAILADYAKKLIIGTSKFVVDTTNGKLFDYGTSGFLFTTRTLAQAPRFNPFRYDKIALSIEHGSTAGGTIKWETKAEDGSWFKEKDINVVYGEGRYTRIEIPCTNPNRSVHKFALRITTLPSNIYIRSIQLCVQDLANEAFSE